MASRPASASPLVLDGSEEQRALKIRWVLTGGLASMGARTLVNDCSPEILSLWNQLCRGALMRQTRHLWGEAAVLWEETSECTREASRGRGPSAHARIAEITSGRATIQQGLVATCKDSRDEGNQSPREESGLAHEPG